ncbi:hypothetical protein [Halocella sp. SP3-1]|uniref:hypothetical protein n=1 Tax=Halocella sp. SP3-1 TaxID=2382161 RepID=UPI000F74D8DD|nr:hypothetical protein [Halocella sp. SP3-1]AZO96445.1 hypothetical protein D7D81_18630 [Halocella sp. SP3-1]
MSVNRYCKGCNTAVKLPAGDIYDLLQNNSKFEKELVPKHVYQERIKLCEKCSALIAKTTCRYTGFLIYIAAADKNEQCSWPAGSKW